MSIADPATDYYHINRRVPWSPYITLNPGDVFDVGGSSNPYFNFFEKQKKAYLVTQGDGSKEVLGGARFINAVAMGEVNSPNVAQIADELVRHLVAYIRELIWENVRMKEFPHLPSRQRCIWLIPNIAGVNYWINRMGITGEYQILRVKVQGRLHVASESFLLGDSEPMEETIAKARRYWLGIIETPGTEEILFEGRVKVMGLASNKERHT